MVRNLLRLVRLPNLFTAIADVIAGYFIAYHVLPPSARATVRPEEHAPDLIFLTLASACLYAAGTALNDLFDLEHDRVHNPRRPLPANVVSPGQALGLSAALFTVSLLLAQLVSRPAAINTMAIILLIMAYDTYTKRFPRLGPVNMALIRVFNVLLGMQILVYQIVLLPPALPLPVLMFLYILGLTLLSRAEEVSKRVKGAIKYLVIGIVVLDALALATYGLLPAAGLTLLLVVPPLALSRKFHIS